MCSVAIPCGPFTHEHEAWPQALLLAMTPIALF